MFELTVLAYPGEELSWEGTKLDAPRKVLREPAPFSRPEKLLGEPWAGGDGPRWEMSSGKISHGFW